MKRKKVKEKTKRERVEDWLITYQGIFNILGIEKKLLLPKGTLHKFLKYDRKMTDQRIETLNAMIEDMAFRYLDKE